MKIEVIKLSGRPAKKLQISKTQFDILKKLRIYKLGGYLLKVVKDD